MKKLIFVLGVIFITASSFAQRSGNSTLVSEGGTYTNLNDADFSVAVLNGTKRAVVTGLSFTLEAKNVTSGFAQRITTDGVASSIPLTAVTISTDTITFSDWTGNFAATDVCLLFLKGHTKGYDIPQDAEKTIEQAPDYAHYTDIEHIIDETNLDTDSAYAAFYMASYQYFNLHANLSGGVTLTVYVTNNSGAADDDETSDWVDYSTTFLGGASIVDTEGIYFQDTPFMPLKVLVKVVTSDATNSADVWVRRHY